MNMPAAVSVTFPALDTDGPGLLAWVADFYRRTLVVSEEAQRFLALCGVDFAAAAGTHRLGYANRTLGSAIVEQRELRNRLQALGVFRADSGHEHLNGCLIFPLTNDCGNVVQLWGCRLAQTASPRGLALPGTDRGVFNASGLSSGSNWCLCADPLDAFTLFGLGHKSVTASVDFGLNQDLRRLIDARKPAQLTIVHSSDAVDSERVAVLEKELSQSGLLVSRARLPVGQTLHD
jgi:hypothetical protein